MKLWRYLRIGLWSWVFILLLASTLAFAQKPDSSIVDEPVTLPNSEVKLFHSQFTNQDYKIFIALPPDYAKTDQLYPAIYVLDAQFTFGTVTEYIRRMSFVKELPELIIVGIGYTTDDVDDIIALRIHDFTPTVVSDMDKTGSADNFLSFITEELFPFTETNYRVDPVDRGLVGHSLGGLFTLYALLSKPNSFQRYVASSPSLWWDSRYLFNYEESFAQTHSSLNARLFISAGELETDPTVPIAQQVPEFVELLKQHHYNGLELSTTIFEGETHASVVAGALTKGIRLVYDSVSSSSKGES